MNSKLISVQETADMIKSWDNILILCHKNPDGDKIPCYRVVNAKGELAGKFAFGGAKVQEERLRADGVEVVDGRVDLKKYGMDHFGERM